jgi:hypothetical protein
MCVRRSLYHSAYHLGLCFRGCLVGTVPCCVHLSFSAHLQYVMTHKRPIQGVPLRPMQNQRTHHHSMSAPTSQNTNRRISEVHDTVAMRAPHLENFSRLDRIGAAALCYPCLIVGMFFCLLVPSETTTLKKPNLKDNRDSTRAAMMGLLLRRPQLGRGNVEGVEGSINLPPGDITVVPFLRMVTNLSWISNITLKLT